MFKKTPTMTSGASTTPKTLLSKLIELCLLGFLLFTAAAAVTTAAAADSALASTNYDVLIGDVNGDGREDILMKAVPRTLMIPLDDDLMIPIAVPAKTPSFALMSDAYWGYVLVPNPDAQLLQSNWSATSSGTLQFGANGLHTDTVRIQSASGEFVIAFSDVSQQLSLVQQPGVINMPGTVTYIHTDGLGSPVARTNAAGQLLSRTLYEPYGYVAMGETPTIGFTGHVNDADTGLTYMQQRYYDPVAGRFLSIDPVTTDADTGSSFNRYAYAENNPFKFTDPDGRNPLLIAMGVGALVGGGVNAGMQYMSTGEVRWGGVGGVLDAASDGAMFGLMGGMVSSAGSARSAVASPAASASAAVQAPVKTDFIVTSGGVATHTTANEVRASLNGAGMAGKAVQNSSGTEAGTIHNVPAMKMDIRVMDGGPVHPTRAVMSRQGTSQPVNPANGRNFGNVPKAEQRAASHITLPEKTQ